VIIEVNYLVIGIGFTSVIMISIITNFLSSAYIQRAVFKSVSNKFYTQQAYRGKISKGLKKKIIEDISANSPMAGVINSMLPGTKEYLINNPDSIETFLEYIDLIQKRFPDLVNKVSSVLVNIGGDNTNKEPSKDSIYEYSHNEIT